MSRSWCLGAPGEEPKGDVQRKGVAQIMDAIMASVGGADPVEGLKQPAAVTTVETQCSSTLPDMSGILTHVTGYISICQCPLRRFSQSVVLEPCPSGRPFLFVRTDVVQYWGVPLPGALQPGRLPGEAHGAPLLPLGLAQLPVLAPGGSPGPLGLSLPGAAAMALAAPPREAPVMPESTAARAAPLAAQLVVLVPTMPAPTLPPAASVPEAPTAQSAVEGPSADGLEEVTGGLAAESAACSGLLPDAAPGLLEGGAFSWAAMVARSAGPKAAAVAATPSKKASAAPAKAPLPRGSPSARPASLVGASSSA